MLVRFRIPFVAVISLLLLASCTKTNKQGRYIPKDAGFVLHIDGASLNTKLPWSEIKQNPLFQQIYADSTTPVFIKQALDSPDNSGIDIKADLAFYAQNDSTGSIVGFTGTIKDAEKFRLFNLDATKGGSESENNGVKFISKSPACVGYNKERFLYIINQNHASRDLLAACSAFFDLKESNSLGENEKFTTLVKTAGDLHLWINAENANNLKQLNTKIPMVNLASLSEGNITAATVNFENGKILVATKSYVSKDIAAVFKKYSGKNFDEEMLKRLPTKDVAAVFALGYNPEAINGFIKVLGVEGFTPLLPKFAGFSIEEFIKANKGDLMIAVTGVRQKSMLDSIVTIHDTMENLPTTYLEPDVIFATSIGDKDAFGKLIKAGEKFASPFLSEFHATYNSDGKYFALSNSKENVDKYFDKSSTNNFDFLSKISGNPFGGYVNFQYLIKTFENFQMSGEGLGGRPRRYYDSSITNKESSMKTLQDASLKMWDNAFIKGGDYSDGGITQSIEINLMDKNTNSLKQLNQYMGLVGKFKMEMDKKEQLNDKMTLDILKSLPPPPSK